MLAPTPDSESAAGTGAAPDIATLSKRLTDAVSAGDFATVRSMFAPEGRIWHNFDNAEVTLEENLPQLEGLLARCDLHYEDVELVPSDAGWVQLHTVRAVYGDGRERTLPCCQVFRLGPDGKIVRLEEYLDGSGLAAVAQG